MFKNPSISVEGFFVLYTGTIGGIFCVRDSLAEKI